MFKRIPVVGDVLDVGVLDVVGEAVVVGASVFVWLVVSVFVCALVSAVAGSEGVVGTDMLEVGVVGALTTLAAGVVTDVVAVFTGDAGFIGLIGDAGLVTLVIDFTQLSDVVTQGCHTGLPYGSGHVEERVWVMLPV